MVRCLDEAPEAAPVFWEADAAKIASRSSHIKASVPGDVGLLALCASAPSDPDPDAPAAILSAFEALEPSPDLLWSSDAPRLSSSLWPDEAREGAGCSLVSEAVSSEAFFSSSFQRNSKPSACHFQEYAIKIGAVHLHVL